MGQKFWRVVAAIVAGALVGSLGPAIPVAGAEEATPGPGNDDFGDAVVLYPPATWDGDTTGSTVEAGEPTPSCANEPGTGSVWFRFTPAESGAARITVTTPEADLVIATHTGDRIDSLSEVDCTDGPAAGTEIAYVSVSAGVNYSIAVAGWTRSDYGEFHLTLEMIERPANDDFADAAAVPINSSVTGTTLAATVEKGEPDHECVSPEASVWYRFTAESTTTLRLHATGYQAIAAYEGNSLTSLRPIACAASESYPDVGIRAGHSYAIAIVPRWTPGREFTLSTTTHDPPPNDDLGNATAVTAPTTIAGTTAFSTLEPDERAPTCTGRSSGSVWYRYEAPVDGVLALTQDRSGHAIAVHEGTSFAELLGASCTLGDEPNQVRVRAGRSYAVAVSATYSWQRGTFNLTLTTVADPPHNDDFAMAETFSFESEEGVAPVTIAGDTTRASLEVGEARPSCAGGRQGASVWYRVTTPAAPAGDGLIRTSLPSAPYHRTAVFSSSADGTLREVACGPSTEASVEPSTTYYLAVWAGSGYHNGPFSLTASFGTSPPNDDFDDAMELGLPAATTGSTRNASEEIGEQSCGVRARSVWYRIEPADGQATVNLVHSTNLTLGVYVGDGNDSPQSLTQVNCYSMRVDAPFVSADLSSYTTTAAFPVAGERPYYLQVISHSTSGEEFALSAEVAEQEGPANDDFSDPAMLMPAMAHDGSTLGATVQKNEKSKIDCEVLAGVTPSPQRSGTVWYEFTPEVDEVARIRLASTADLGFAVFEGSSLEALDPVACRNRRAPGLDEVRDLSVTGGTTYRVLVRHSGQVANDPNAGGDFAITLEYLAVPGNDAFQSTTGDRYLLDGATEVTGDTGKSGVEPGEPGHPCMRLGSEPYRHTVWYRFASQTDGSAVVTLNSESDQGFAIYYGESLERIRALQCVDAPLLEQEAYTANIAGGRNYYIAVLARNIDETGQFRLGFRFTSKEGPPNDDFANATELVMGPNVGDLTGATTEFDEPVSCQWSDPPSGTVWYQFTVPDDRDGLARLDLTGLPLGTVGVFRGASLDTIGTVACSDGLEAGLLLVPVTAGTTYYVSVAPLLDASGAPFTVDYSFFAHPPNDDRTSAELLELESEYRSTAGDTRGATGEPDDPWWCVRGEGTVWYRFVPPNDGVARFTVQSSNPIDFVVLEEQWDGVLDQIGCGQASDNDVVTGAASATVELERGSTYYLMVGADHRRSDGDFTLSWDYTPAPHNDDFSAAESLVLGNSADGIAATAVTGDLAGATTEREEPRCNLRFSDTAGTAWYRFTPPENGTLKVSLVSALNNSLAVYTGTELSNLRMRTCTPALSFDSSFMTGEVTAATSALFVEKEVDYWISVAVGGVRPEPAPFQLSAAFTTVVSGPTVAISDAQSDEGPTTVEAEVESGDVQLAVPAAATFEVRLSHPSPTPVRVRYRTDSGTATADTDFTARAGDIYFAPYEVVRLVSIPIIDDALDEPGEHFHVALYEPDGGVIADGAGRGTIEDDDDQVTVAAADASVTETRKNGRSLMTFTLTLDSPSGHLVRVAYATADGSATAGSDYVGNSGIIEFAPGETTKTVTITVVGDNNPEGDEWFALRLSDPSHADVGDAESIGTIVDDDPVRGKR